ncbi:MAG: chromosome segregation protein SMC [Promethearchaeota archaeon]
MVYIKRMICAGFKSFRKRTIINFDKGFTAIVGANGSGKSNIIDAFSFVLGELSSKTLRANNIKDLISNGGKGFEPSQTASVEIFFDNSDQGFPLESQEVCISRKINRSGQSVYKINNKRTTRKEIINLLDLAGFMPNSSNMIMQGELFRLINMSPNDRRELIEEIAGISSYNNKKQSAEEELNQVQSNLAQVSLLLNEVYLQLEQLEKEKQDAEKFLELEAKEKIHQNAFIQTQINQTKHNLEVMGEKKVLITQQIQEIQAKQKDLHAEIGDIELKIHALLPKIRDLQDEKLRKLTSQLKLIKEEITEQNASLKYSKQNLENFEDERKKLYAKISELEQEEHQVLQKITDLENKKESFSEQIQIKENEIQTFNNQLETIDRDYIELKKKANQLQNRIDQVKDKRSEIDLALKVNQRRIKDLETRKISLDQKIYQKLQEIEKLKQNVADLEKKQMEKLGLSEINSFSKGNIEKKIEELEENVVRWQHEMKNIKPILLQKQQKVFELQSQQRLEKEMNHAGRISAILKELRQKSQIEGIHGSIAELGTTDPKFQKALDMAVGSRFQYIVVDNQQVGEMCIKYLKKKNLGRASFIPLQEIKYSPFSPSLPSNKKIFGRAIDLIKFDQKFYHAFEYIFGRIIIVEDLITARQLQVPAKRVTLDGDIVDGSNLMTGGKMKSSSRFGFFKGKTEKNILHQEKAELADLLQQENQLSVQIRHAQDEISRLYKIKISGANKTKEISEQIAINNAKIHQLHADIVQNKKEIEQLEMNIQDFSQLLKENQDTFKEISNELDMLKTQLADIQKQLDSSEESQIKTKLRKTEKELADFTKNLNKIEVELAKNQTILSDTLRKNRKEAQALIKEKSEQIEKSYQQIQDLTERISESQAQFDSLQTTVDQKSQKLAKILKEKDNLTMQISEKKIQVAKFENQVHPLNMQLNTIEIKANEMEIKIQEWKCQINPEVRIEPLLLEKSPDYHQKQLREIQKLKDQLGPVNLRAIDKYREIEVRFNELQQKNEQVIDEREAILAFIDSLEQEKLRVFMNNFNAINSNFGYVFGKLSPGGEAKLELENPETPFDGGIQILARPGEKKWCLTQAMSGGEKTLTIIALILGIQMHVPSPYYILDEIDAALDDVNASLVAEMIKELSVKSQFVIITHRDVTMARVDHLLGVSNIEGVTSVLNLSIQKVLQQIQANENKNEGVIQT